LKATQSGNIYKSDFLIHARCAWADLAKLKRVKGVMALGHETTIVNFATATGIMVG